MSLDCGGENVRASALHVVCMMAAPGHEHTETRSYTEATEDGEKVGWSGGCLQLR